MNQTLQKEKQTNIQLRDIAGEAIQNETERPKKKKKRLKNKQNNNELWAISSSEIIAKISQFNHRFQKLKKLQPKRNIKKTTRRHIITQLLLTNDSKKILKAVIERRHISHKTTKVRMMADF